MADELPHPPKKATVGGLSHRFVRRVDSCNIGMDPLEVAGYLLTRDRPLDWVQRGICAGSLDMANAL